MSFISLQSFIIFCQFKHRLGEELLLHQGWSEWRSLQHMQKNHLSVSTSLAKALLRKEREMVTKIKIWLLYKLHKRNVEKRDAANNIRVISQRSKKTIDRWNTLEDEQRSFNGERNICLTRVLTEQSSTIVHNIWCHCNCLPIRKQDFKNSLMQKNGENLTARWKWYLRVFPCANIESWYKLRKKSIVQILRWKSKNTKVSTADFHRQLKESGGKEKDNIIIIFCPTKI